MKKLGKLTINPEKVIKNEELINLRGGGYDGYESGTCAAICQMPDGGHRCNVSKSEAEKYASDCNEVGGTGNWCCDSCSSSTWYNQVC